MIREALDASTKTWQMVRDKTYLFYFVYFALVLWCIYGITNHIQIFQSHTLEGSSIGGIVAQIVSLKIMLVTFTTLFYNQSSRVIILGMGVVSILITGTYIGFYDPIYALSKVDATTISMLFGMALFSSILGSTNAFEMITRRLIERFGRYYYALFVILVLLTFILSLFINNLTTMLLILPITLTLTNQLKLKATPFIIGLIVASNLGGASSMVGDFPNMLIASKMQISFDHFIKYMMPIGLINLGVMLWYFYYHVDFGVTKEFKEQEFNLKLPKVEINNQWAATFSMIILAIMVFCFIFIKINPGLIALIGAGILLVFSGVDRKKIIDNIQYEDLLFFIFLFIMVGGVEASGLLKTITNGVLYLAMGNIFLKMIILMWGACFLTMFFNAGPTTMMFLPMFLTIHGVEPTSLIFWALSLGVCAGSSGSLNGATAGPVSSTLLERFSINQRKYNSSDLLDYQSYSVVGLPIMYLHLLVSTLYIVLIYWWNMKII
jgi:Na+/H+ antiporter NhaD/arsenite permease-like protein